MLPQIAVRNIAAKPQAGGTAGRNFVPGSHGFLDTIAPMGAEMVFSRNEEIFGEDEPADYLYKVVTGTVRIYKILSDGRRQIVAFHLPGDMFGLEVGEDRAFSAEAVTDASVLVIKRSTIASLAQRDGNLARQLWALTAQELQRVQSHMLLLIKSAQERVATFILEMAERYHDHREVELPMSRQDIADYLGLTIETVSRTLTQFAQRAAIELPNSRRIVLRNRAALIQLNG